MVGREDSRTAVAEILESESPRKSYAPHDGQLEVHASQAKVRIEICGGGWGKTFGAVGEGLARCGILDIIDAGGNRLIPAPTGAVKVVIVEPTYKQAPLAWDAIEDLTPPSAYLSKNKQTHEATFTGGHWIRVRSADNPDSLRGEHPDIWILDEAGRYKPSVYTRIIAPRSVTVGRAGKILILSTPKGKNWLYRLVRAIESGEQPDGQVFRHRSTDSPYVDAKALEGIKKGMTDLDIRQEIEAEFIDDVGGIFAGLAACIRPYGIKSPEPGAVLYWGWDYAETHDYSVIVAIDELGEVRVFERFQGPLTYQIARAKALLDRYGGVLLLDSTGGGSQVLQAAVQAGVPVQGFVITAANKSGLINRLAVSISGSEVAVPNDLEVMIDELEAFAYTRMPSGHVRFEAPAGQHDDCVIALALANWSKLNGASAFQSVAPGEGIRFFGVG